LRQWKVRANECESFLPPPVAESRQALPPCWASGRLVFVKSVSFKGRVREVRSCSGARFAAVSHAPNSIIDSHQHDWPNLTIHLAGACVERFDDTSALLNGPGVVFHPAFSGHADEVLSSGLETVGLMFDPAWLSNFALGNAFDRPRSWLGGRAALAARKLVAIWTSRTVDEAHLRRATAHFFHVATANEHRRPAWLDRASDMLAGESPASTRSIAESLNLHPAWLARRYRQATGEGLHETLRRKRVERALTALRASDAPLAEVALDSGFCDQPHMNRCFRQVLGQSPQAYRSAAQAR